MLSLAPQAINCVSIYCKFSTWLKKLYIFQTWDLVSPRHAHYVFYCITISSLIHMLCLSCNKNEIAWIFHSDRNIIKNMLMLYYCSYLPVSNVNKCGLFCLRFFDFSKSIRLLGYVAFLISFVSTVVDWMHGVIVSPSTSLYLTISWFYSM